jgi:hypothetical protein
MTLVRILIQLTIFIALLHETVFAKLMLIDENSELAHSYADFALQELKKISDSGIYDTLKIEKIKYAAEEDGIYHLNTILKVELSSPFYADGNPSHDFDIVVMQHKEDQVRSIAIDEFPTMDEIEIENFWIRKVQRMKFEREESLLRLEIESLILGEDLSPSGQTTDDLKEHLKTEPLHVLLDELESNATRDFRKNLSLEVLKRLRHESIQNDERKLLSFSMGELFLCYADNNSTKCSDYQQTRAKKILDATMLFLQNRFSNVEKFQKI